MTGTQKAMAVLREYRDEGPHNGNTHELMRMRILTILQSDGRGTGFDYSYMYYSEQLNRIDRGEPIQTLMEWTGLHPRD